VIIQRRLLEVDRHNSLPLYVAQSANARKKKAPQDIKKTAAQQAKNL